MGKTDDLEAMQQKMTQLEAERVVLASKKYCLMLSTQTMVLVACIGAFCVFALYENGKHNMRLMNDRAAYFDWIFAAILGIVAAFWIVYSIKKRREFNAEVQALIASGTVPSALAETFVSWEAPKKAADVRIKYPIEIFETLTPEELEHADDEWDGLALVPTDRFVRLYTVIQPFTDEKVYEVYVEVRYMDSIPTKSLLYDVDEQIYNAVNELKFSSDEMSAFKDAAREVIRKKMLENFPDLYINEICLAAIRIE